MPKPRASDDFVAGSLDLSNEALIELMTRASAPITTDRATLKPPKLFSVSTVFPFSNKKLMAHEGQSALNPGSAVLEMAPIRTSCMCGRKPNVMTSF